ncbi:MAG TPA: hypothetical protein VII97_13465 [Anaerolineales bacterium]
MGFAEKETKERIARILGEKNVRVLDNKWLKKMTEGVIITLHISRWRAKARLTNEDLGLPPVDKDEEKVLEELLLLGEKFLLPAKYVREMESAESAGRKYLARVAYETAYGPFVPFTEYAEVRAELNKYREHFWAVCSNIVENLDNITEEHLATCADAARQAYRRLSKLTPRFKSSDNYIDENGFVTKFLDNITAMIPGKDYLRASFSFDINVSFIPLPSLIAKDMAEATRLQAEAGAEQERIRAEGRVEVARISAEEERIRAQRQLESMKEQEAFSVEEAALRERERKLEEMNRDVLAQARKQKEEMIGGFMKDLLIQLRGMVYETTTDILASIEKNTLIHPRSVAQLNNLVGQIDKLNFFGDEEVTAMINMVRSQFANLGKGEGVEKERSVADIQRSLRNVAILTRSSLVDLGETPRSARSLGVPDVPSENVIRQSRQSLGLDEFEIVELGERAGRRL